MRTNYIISCLKRTSAILGIACLMLFALPKASGQGSVDIYLDNPGNTGFFGTPNHCLDNGNAELVVSTSGLAGDPSNYTYDWYDSTFTNIIYSTVGDPTWLQIQPYVGVLYCNVTDSLSVTYQQYINVVIDYSPYEVPGNPIYDTVTLGGTLNLGITINHTISNVNIVLNSPQSVSVPFTFHAVGDFFSPDSIYSYVQNVTMSSNGVYSYQLSDDACLGSVVDIHVIVRDTLNAGPDQAICQGSTATMAATGTGSWAALASNPAATTITTASAPTTTISGFTAAGIYGFIWAGDTVYITVTPVTAPVLSISGNGCLGVDSIQLIGASESYVQDWYLNGSLIYSHSTVPPYCTAGGNGGGSQPNQLEWPTAVVVDHNMNIYVADGGNDRVQKFPAGSNSLTNGITIAGGNGRGNAANQFHSISAISLDSIGNLYVADAGNNRIQKFAAGSTSATNGVTIAGGNGPGNAANQLQSPSGLVVSNSGDIYVSDGGNFRIQKFLAGSTSATNGLTVAGGNGIGNAADQLNSAGNIALDASNNLYVADVNNNRVQKFLSGSSSMTNGITIAGGNGYGSGPNQFYNPECLVIDKNNNLYVSDNGNNRVQKFPAGSTGATSGVTVAGGNGQGNRIDQLFSPAGITLDDSNNIYIADLNNFRIQKWFLNDPIFFSPSQSGVYTAAYITPNGCNSQISNAVTIVNCLSDSVWPGDADHNGIVDNNDLLTIGLGYDSTGPVRTVQGIVWQADTVSSWAHYFTVYAPLVNFDHADCNGNGIINADDTTAILQNFGLTHAKTGPGSTSWRAGISGLKAVLSADTLYTGDTLTVTFVLGDTTTPAANIYGLAFTYNFDPLVVDSTFTTMTFGSSWLGNADKISIHKIFNSGQIKAAVTRIDHTTRSGSGPIAVVNFKITTDNISGKDFMYYANLGFISDITAIDQHGNPITLNAGADTSQVGYTPTGIRDIETETIRMLPNPAYDKVTISAGDVINNVSICNMMGQEVVRKGGIKNKSILLDTSVLPTGMYLVHVETERGSTILKLLEQK